MMAGRVFDAVQRFRKVEEATSPKDEPAPVYLLDELAEIANSSADNAQALVDVIIKKLANKSPIVRFKALRVVKHMCSGGAVQFQRIMQKHSGSIRDCVTFKGEPDPFKGDVPNARVRELAKQVIELLFITQTPSTSNLNTQSYQGRIQGFGSGSSGQGFSSSSNQNSVTSPTASRYQGFGNPRFEGSNRSSAPNTSGYAAAAGQAVAAAVSTMSSMMKVTTSKTGALKEDSVSDSPRYVPTESYRYSAPALVDASQVLGSEQQLVDDICAPGGLRAIPDAADLQVFADAAGALDGIRTGELLREKMESESWQVVLRALCALAAIVEQGSSQACGECAVMFQSDPTPIRNALSMQQPSVQQQASKVLKLILGEDAPPEAVKKVAKVSTSQAGRPPARSAPAAAAVAAPAADLLVMDSPTKATVPASTNDLDLLGGLSSASEPSTTAAVSAAADGGDALFSGLDVSSQGPAPGPRGIDALSWDAAPVPTQVTQQPQQPLDSLLGGLSMDPTPGIGTIHPSTSNGSLLSSSPDLFSSSTPQAPSPATNPGIHPGMSLPGSMPTPGGMAGPGMMGMGGMAGQGGIQGLGGVAGPGMGGPALGMMGMGVQGMGVQGMGVQGMGMPGMGVPGMGVQGMGMPGMGVPGAFPQGVQMMMGGAPGMMMMMQGAPGMYGGMQMPQQAGMGHAGNIFMQPGLQQPFQQQGNVMLGAAAGGPPAANPHTWQGNDDLSNLMRHVASHGKHDPAFDFIKDEFRNRS